MTITKPCVFSVRSLKRTASGNESGDDAYKWVYNLSPPMLGDLMENIDELLSYRKMAILEREWWIARKKEAGRDAELAKFCKSEERLWMGRYRACCLLIGWVATLDLKDCPVVEPYYWSEELHPHVTSVYVAVCYEHFKNA
jgi:hypothetical protein